MADRSPQTTPRAKIRNACQAFISATGRPPKRTSKDMSEERLAERYAKLPIGYKDNPSQDRQTSVSIFREVLTFVAEHDALPRKTHCRDRQPERSLYERFKRARSRRPFSALELQLLAEIDSRVPLESVNVTKRR